MQTDLTPTEIAQERSINLAEAALDDALAAPSPATGDALTAALEGMLDALTPEGVDRDPDADPMQNVAAWKAHREQQVLDAAIEALAADVAMDTDQYTRLFGTEEAEEIAARAVKAKGMSPAAAVALVR